MENSGPRHLEDLPHQELEGAPPGWGSRQITRKKSQSLPSAMSVGRRSSALPTAKLPVFDVRRPSAARERRESQMTFNEWCQTKKLQKLHEAALRARRDSKEEEEEEEHAKNSKRNISFKEWSKATEERHRSDVTAHERQKLREEEEREAMESAKYRRRMSFDQWKSTKDIAKFNNERSKLPQTKEESGLDSDDRKRKAEEAHRKWIIKKELEEMKKDRDMRLRIPNASLNVGSASASMRPRRTSWIDDNAALQVQVNREKMTF